LHILADIDCHIMNFQIQAWLEAGVVAGVADHDMRDFQGW
jgi:hypothetical protein